MTAGNRYQPSDEASYSTSGIKRQMFSEKDASGKSQMDRIQETLGHRSLDDILTGYSLKDFAESFLADTPIYETVKVDNSLFALKVADTVEQGAEYVGKTWRECVRVFEMPLPASKINVPKSDETLYNIHQGRAQGGISYAGGGHILSVPLDTTDPNTIRYTEARVNEDDIKSRNFNTIEAVLYDAGNALATNTLKTVVKAIYAAEGVSSSATGADVRLADIQNQMEAAGFYPDTLIAVPAAVLALRTYQKGTGGSGPMPYADQRIWGDKTNLSRVGQIGTLWDYDVIRVAWGGVNTDIPDYILTAKNKGLYVGLGEDINIRGPEVDLLHGLTEAVIETRYCTTTANANAIGVAAY